MKRVFAVILLSLTAGFSITSCQSPQRRPSSTTGAVNLLNEVQSIASEVANPAIFNLQTCETYSRNIYQSALNKTPAEFDVAAARADWNTIYNKLWSIRVQLRERLKEFAAQAPADSPNMVDCVKSLRDGFRLSRWIEDYLAESFSGEPQDFVAGNPKNQFDPKFRPTPFQGNSPWLVTSPKISRMTLRSGDVIVSRGNAYTSSAIARISDIDSQFSHLAFVYIAGDGDGREYTVDEALANPKVFVLEAHIEVGSTIRPLREYFADGNARNLVFRYFDARVAHESAKWSFNYMTNYQQKAYKANRRFPPNDVNYHVPYNFQMGLENPTDPGKLFCTQVGHVGFHNNGVKVPLYISTLNPKLSLPNRLGITSTQIFSPSDLEVDPRFEMIGEYRNLRKLKGLRMKDMVLSAMYRMMESGYELNPDPLLTSKAIYAWVGRQMDAEFTKKELPKNMNVKILSTVLVLDRVGTFLEKELDRAERDLMKRNGSNALTLPQGLEVLEQVRAKDRELFFTNVKPGFHWDFKPRDLHRPGSPY